MTDREVGRRFVGRRRWTMLLAGALVVGGSMAIRYWMGSSSASADATRPAPRPETPAAPGPQKAGAPAPASKAVPETVAVINGQPISRQTLAQRCLERFGESVLESLVNKQLILQACREKGITITPEEINREVAQTAAKFKLSTDQWLNMLHSERNISPETYKRDIVWPMLALRRLAADRMTVTPEELQMELESEFGPKVQVRMIAVSKREEAERLHALAVADPDKFQVLAKEHSEDPNSAAARGLIPPIARHVGDKEIERVVFSMQPGDISPILEVHKQFLIFKCERHLPATELRPEHREIVASRARERILDRKLRVAAAEIFEQLQASATVVNVWNDPKLREQHPGIAATINGQPVPISYLAEESIARHGLDVLDAEINYVLLQQAMRQAGIEVSRADLQQEMARQAEAFGYITEQGAADVERWIQDATQEEGVSVEYYVRDAIWPLVALHKLVADQVQVTPDDLQKGFEANYGERVEVLAIVVANQRIAQEVWELASENRTREYFAQLASRYSIEPVSRANLGEVPPIQRHSGQPALEKEAFSLKPGELSGIIAVGNQYVILHCLGRTTPVVQSLDEVRDELTKDLYQRKLNTAMATKFDDLKASAQIDNFLAGTSQPGNKKAPATAARPADPPRR